MVTCLLIHIYIVCTNIIDFHLSFSLQIDDQKAVKSWSVRRGLKLTNVTLWDSSREEFATIVNAQVLFEVCLDEALFMALSLEK